MTSERNDALLDREYVNGFDAGWNAGYQAGAEAERRSQDFGRRDDGQPSWVAALWRSVNARRDAAIAVLRRA